MPPRVFDRVVIGVDVQGFSTRLHRRQLLIQDNLDQILTQAARAADLDRDAWDRQISGDGEVAVLPGGEDLLLVTRRFVTELDQLLADHNEDHHEETRIRLRVAMNLGSVIPGGRLGYSGDALIGLARLLDSKVVRQALADVPAANLVQIISESLFQRAVVPEVGGVRSSQFRKVVVDIPEKGFRESAYLYVPGGWPEPPQPVRSPGSRLPRQRPPVPFFPPSVSFPEPAVAVKSPEPEIRASQAETTTAPLNESVLTLVGELRDALAAGRYGEADGLTTRILLEAAKRSREGSLRIADAERLPDDLLTELDSAWAGSSGGRWGFGAQRKRLESLTASSYRQFHYVSLALGWRQSEDQIPQPYPEFVEASRDPDLPFFPTLRHPDQEKVRDEAWRDAWKMTAVSVQLRLRSWE